MPDVMLSNVVRPITRHETTMDNDDGFQNCPTCNGSGKQRVAELRVIDGKGYTQVTSKDCTVCGGMGVIPGTGA